MPIRPKLLIAAGAALGVAALLPASAGAYVSHTVAPGETLWSIATASNLTTRALAVYNGLSPESNVVLGSTIRVPSEEQAAAALAGAGGGQASPSAGGGSAPPPAGSYTVRPGDTLSSIAASSGISVDQLAWMNGIDPHGPLLAGTALKLPSGAPLASVPEQQPSSPVIPDAAPYPTNERTNDSELTSIAAANGVPASLAKAIAWQESGWNNAMVSAANARGVMQIMPGTWDWINQNLTPQPLNPASVHTNVTAGVLYLGQLLRDTGGDIPTAVAAYYQGLGSVQRQGMFDDTQEYVNSVLALRQRFLAGG